VCYFGNKENRDYVGRGRLELERGVIPKANMLGSLRAITCWQIGQSRSRAWPVINGNTLPNKVEKSIFTCRGDLERWKLLRDVLLGIAKEQLPGHDLPMGAGAGTKTSETLYRAMTTNTNGLSKRRWAFLE